ncbi:MAG TPA: hypothetical protein VN285_07535 [Candidatus Deferrimicrobium sp.]|nr:hypothetical protein [Candidatus Deferrimicrobium sp.]
MRWTACLLSLWLLVATLSTAECWENRCGDVDGVTPFEFPDAADVMYMESFLFQNGMPPPCTAAADVDTYQRITLRDLLYLVTHFFQGPLPTCPPANPPLNPPLHPNVFVELDDPVFPPNDSTVIVHLMFGNEVAVTGVILPVWVLIDYESPNSIDVLSIDSAFTAELRGYLYHQVDAANGRFMIGGWTLSGGLTAGYRTLATLKITIDPSTAYRDITVGWSSFPPVQDSVNTHYPLVLEPNLTPWKPDLHTYDDCQFRGNVDHIVGVGGIIDVADLVYLVEFFFHGGAPPPSFDEGDVDGITGPAGSIDVSDLTFLVAYLFQGGAPPPPCP